MCELQAMNGRGEWKAVGTFDSERQANEAAARLGLILKRIVPGAGWQKAANDEIRRRFPKLFAGK